MGDYPRRVPQIEVRGQFEGLEGLQYAGTAKTLSARPFFAKVARS